MALIKPGDSVIVAMRGSLQEGQSGWNRVYYVPVYGNINRDFFLFIGNFVSVIQTFRRDYTALEMKHADEIPIDVDRQLVYKKSKEDNDENYIKRWISKRICRSNERK